MMREFGYWSTGIQYLHIVDVVAQKLIENENVHVVISNKEITEEEYNDKTRWSDFNLILPLLFNFYHGIEVILKGFLAAKGKPVKGHNLKELLKDFSGLYTESTLNNLLGKYIYQDQLKEPLASFFEQSSSTADEFYQALKYPESTKGEPYKHEVLMEKGSEGISFFKILVNDIRNIRIEAVRVGRALLE